MMSANTYGESFLSNRFYMFLIEVWLKFFPSTSITLYKYRFAYGDYIVLPYFVLLRLHSYSNMSFRVALSIDNSSDNFDILSFTSLGRLGLV